MNSLKIQTNAKIPAFGLDSKNQCYPASSQIAIGLDLENLLSEKQHNLNFQESHTDQIP